uniref:Uncharacterized protein n=1 Tax=Chromera velia CCMP2878 TaxID=1169474 RepID=A0A0G4GEV6_9ALVE|eukprot:Cvel_21571.t1-p1 / transcript=Cvel_21571.t1 / gene=Cvel_21571 / organism=Chromera_velia_CCMP2878 / gene_product=hypothetical protein / transcript_product=hypothetical protein / location=Cvel_scaffold2035:7557-10923(-) / protein_length=389 / sequence_SO=supercontig / SO=protein_coding / is_pseudo=false
MHQRARPTTTSSGSLSTSRTKGGREREDNSARRPLFSDTKKETDRAGGRKIEKPKQANRVDPRKNYFVATWRRTPFNPNGFVQALNGNCRYAHLENFDAPRGNRWRFHFLDSACLNFTLECVNPNHETPPSLGGQGQEQGGELKTPAAETASAPVIGPGSKGGSRLRAPPAAERWLAPDLRLVEREDDAAVWEYVEHPKFRGGDSDVGLVIRAEGSSLLLCSEERTGRVTLMSREEAAGREGPDGGFRFNIAWEATPDDDSVLEALLSKEKEAAVGVGGGTHLQLFEEDDLLTTAAAWGGLSLSETPPSQAGTSAAVTGKGTASVLSQWRQPQEGPGVAQLSAPVGGTWATSSRWSGRTGVESGDGVGSAGRELRESGTVGLRSSIGCN